MGETADAVTEGRHISGSMTAVMIRYIERLLGTTGVEELLRRAGDDRPVSEISDIAGWSSYPQACALIDAARATTGDADVGFRIGEEMLRQHAGTEVAALLRSLGSPGELLRNIAATGSKYSTITDMEALSVDETSAMISAKTASGFQRHRLFCDYTAGILSQASALFGLDPALVEEVECQTRGFARCVFEVRWDPATSSEIDPERRVEHLEQQLAVLAERFEALQATAAELVTVSDVETLLARIARRAGTAVRAPAHVLAVRLPGEDTVRVHGEGVDSARIEEVVSEVLDASDADASSGRLVVDVKSARHHYGRLAALYPPGTRFFPQERRLLGAYAAQAAAALDTATALRDVSRRNDTARDLLRLSAELANVVSGDDVASRIATAVPTVVDCDHAAVLLWDSTAKQLAMRGSVGLHREVDDVFRALSISPTDTPLLEGILADKRPLFLDADTPDPFVRGLLDTAQSVAAVVVPISTGGEFFGIVTAGVYTDAARVRSSDHVVERLQGLAAQAASALQNARLLDEIRHRALHDPLTGLPNRTLLRDRLDHALEHAARRSTAIAVLFVDLDGFKAINDGHGHAVGDEVIISAADRIRGALRPSDTVARIGGDEFAIVLPDLEDEDGSDVVALKVLGELRRPIELGDEVFHISASIGVAIGHAGDSYDTVVNQADQAMYAAKRQGRNQHVTAGRAEPAESVIDAGAEAYRSAVPSAVAAPPNRGR